MVAAPEAKAPREAAKAAVELGEESLELHVLAENEVVEPENEPEEQEELICFDRKSAWSIPLVISAKDFMEAFFACALLMVNVAMQSLFTLIIASPEFLGTDFKENVQSAETWRSSFAHNVAYVDLSGKSLATRVCDEDGSLIYSTSQVDLVSHINSYLGLSKLGSQGFAVTSFQPGVLLAVLCILLWIICVVRELRSVWYVLQAVVFGRSLGGMRLSGRRAAAMAMVCLARAGVACALLVSGTLWLSRTTSITELMLNAVALEAVLHVDEFIFSAFVPTRLQQKIQRLPPCMLKKSSRWPQVENLLLASILMAALGLPYFLLLSPLKDDMLAVKTALCGGELTFAVGMNNQLVGRTQTTGPGALANRSYEQVVAMEYAFPNASVQHLPSLNLPGYSVLLDWMNRRYEEFQVGNDVCYRHGIGADYSIFLAVAAFEARTPEARSCEDGERASCSVHVRYDM